MWKMKDPASTWTHFITFIAAIIGLVFLMNLAKDDTTKLISMIIYGASLILLYAASSVYHWIQTTPEKELMLKKIDHVSIYILIAGTYTPVFMLGLTGTWRITMLIMVWALAVVGMLLKVVYIGVPRYVSTILYVILGWFALVPFYQLLLSIPTGGIALMIIGGLFYTVGAVIYATKWPDPLPKVFGFHEVFHLFVMAGSISHFFMMVYFILPLSS